MIIDRNSGDTLEARFLNYGGGMASGNDSGLGSSRGGDTLASIVHSQTGTMSTPHPNNRNMGNGLPGPQFLSQSSRTNQIPLSSSNNSEADRKDRFTGLSYKEREERVRQLRVKQQEDRQRKLEELKEQAASAQRFREQQEFARRQRFEEMRNRDLERKQQVEERKKIILQAEQERREAVLRKNEEREQRIELKKRQERSNVVFAFGSSTPRMLNPKDNIHQDSSFSNRRSTSTSNVNVTTDSASAAGTRRTPTSNQDTDLSRKRAVSAHSLNRKATGDDDSMHPFEMRSTTTTTAARRRTDLMPTIPLSQDSPRQRSPGETPLRPKNLSASLHEPHSSLSKSMSHIGPRYKHRLGTNGASSVESRPIVGALDRRTSRSSLVLSRPRLTRAETLKLSKLRASTSTPSNNSIKGPRSGNVTPAGGSSRPTSSLSQSSTGQLVPMRAKSSPKKPRPMSIAGSVLSSADRPRSIGLSHSAATTPTASINTRAWEKRLSSGSIDGGATPTRNRVLSAVSDSTTSKTRTPSNRKTPAQVKAESAAKKASERSKTQAAATSKPRSTPKAISVTPVQSPVVVDDCKIVSPESNNASQIVDSFNLPSSLDEEKIETAPLEISSKQVADLLNTSNEEPEDIRGNDGNSGDSEEGSSSVSTDTTLEVAPVVANTAMGVAPAVANATLGFAPMVDNLGTLEDNKAPRSMIDKPITGYASEEEYRAALAEKRRQAREAKERELEMEKQRQFEEEERERKEEEEYLRLMEEQKKAEEERLRLAIEEAEKQRKLDAVKREEEEKLRIEAEKIEQQKKIEAEERMRKEDEERQLRKSRVAAIMSRTRGSKGSGIPSKSDANTPLDDESKSLNNNTLMTESMAENLINHLSSTSMTDSMIVEAIESEKNKDFAQLNSKHEEVEKGTPILPNAALVNGGGGTGSQQTNGAFDDNFSIEQEAKTPVESGNFDLLSSIGLTNDSNGITHNGTDKIKFEKQESENMDDPFAPLNPMTKVDVAPISPAMTFDQIIDFNVPSSKFINEDSNLKNSPPPPSTIIAFEENLTKKSQDTTSGNVPDILL